MERLHIDWDWMVAKGYRRDRDIKKSDRPFICFLESMFVDTDSLKEMLSVGEQELSVGQISGPRPEFGQCPR